MKDGLITNETELRAILEMAKKIARVCDNDQVVGRVTDQRYWSGYNAALNEIAPSAQQLVAKLRSILVDCGVQP